MFLKRQNDFLISPVIKLVCARPPAHSAGSDIDLSRMHHVPVWPECNYFLR